MRKGLLTSSALMGVTLIGAPAMAATPTVGDALGVTITGYVRNTFLWYDQTQKRTSASDPGKGFQLRGADESEIVFRARGKADNGLAYGFDVEIQTQTDNTIGGGEDFNADEAWAFTDSATFGRIEIGDQDDAPDRIMIDGADAQAGRGGNNFTVSSSTGAGGFISGFGGSLTALDSASIAVTGDASKLIYFTPRWVGFQAGFSYTPDSAQNGGIAANDQGTSTNVSLTQGKARDFMDVYGFGANYQNKIAGVDVLLAGTYQFGSSVGCRDASITVCDNNNQATGNLNDLNIWSVGGQFKYVGFTFAAGYADWGKTGVPRTCLGAVVTCSSRGADAGQWWNIGLMYTTGPWDFSAGYFNGWGSNGHTALGAALPDSTMKQYAASATYRVAPGWVLAGDIIHFEQVNKSQRSATAPNSNNDAHGFMFVLSSTLTF